MFFFASFVTRSNLGSFATGFSLWAESVQSVMAFLSVLSSSSFSVCLCPLPGLAYMPLVSGPSRASEDSPRIPSKSYGSSLPAALLSFLPTPSCSSPVGIVYRAILPHLRFLFISVWTPCPLRAVLHWGALPGHMVWLCPLFCGCLLSCCP